MMKNENGNRKPGIGNRTFVRILLVSIVLCSLVIVPVAAAKLATPTLIFPANNYHLYNKFTILAWKPVPGAGYHLRVEQKIGPDWVFFDGQYIGKCYYDPIITTPGSYRWRVTATSANPADDSAPTLWRTFDYYTHPQTLSAPTPISPQSGTTFYHTPRVIVFEWKPVMGANEYQIWIQHYNTASKSWEDEFPPFPITGTLNTFYYDNGFSGAFKGRWCVMARDTTNSWADSQFSAWKTFEFKN